MTMGWPGSSQWQKPFFYKFFNRCGLCSHLAHFLSPRPIDIIELYTAEYHALSQLAGNKNTNKIQIYLFNNLYMAYHFIVQVAVWKPVFTATKLKNMWISGSMLMVAEKHVKVSYSDLMWTRYWYWTHCISLYICPGKRPIWKYLSDSVRRRYQIRFGPFLSDLWYVVIVEV